MVFIKSDIQHPMEGVFDSPMRTDGLVYQICIRFKATDIQSVLFLYRLIPPPLDYEKFQQLGGGGYLIAFFVDWIRIHRYHAYSSHQC